MIVTSQPDAIIEKIHKKLHRGATIIHNAEGTYNHQEKAVLLTVITRAEFNEFKYIMKKLILRLLSLFQKTFISLDALWKQKNKNKVPHCGDLILFIQLLGEGANYGQE